MVNYWNLDITPVAGLTSQDGPGEIKFHESIQAGTVIAYLSNFKPGENLAGLSFVATPNSAGDDGGNFAFQYNQAANRWEIVLAQTIDYENLNTYGEFNFTGTGSAVNYEYSAYFSAIVMDANDNPEDIALTKADGSAGQVIISENTENGTKIGNLSAFDDDEYAEFNAMGFLNYQIVNDQGQPITNGPFEIVKIGNDENATFELHVRDKSQLQVAQDTDFKVRVKVIDPESDATSGFAFKEFTVKVTATQDNQPPQTPTVTTPVVLTEGTGHQVDTVATATSNDDGVGGTT
ncbi:cadherin repeat domain-containing protein, partial [Microvirga rosea]|uniref:cadherin repeat domain-containing protein n=1 Tax=Microvirga rosea TaxID=2715425 RepID=UPI001D0A9CC6